MAAGVSVDTIRFYQSRGLLKPPEREGRAAVYGAAHLRTLRRIRDLAEQGLSLKVIKRLLDSGSSGTDRRLLAAVETASGSRELSRTELAAETGVPAALLRSLEAAGLWGDPRTPGSEAIFAEADAELIRLGLRLLEAGLPLDRLLALATSFNSALEAVAEGAVDLFNDAVRRREDAEPGDIVAAFNELLPAATSLVALHFRRTVVAKGRARLVAEAADDPDAQALADAIEDAVAPEVELRWRPGSAG